MYPHHEKALKKLIDLFSGREEIIALVFGGSVAKGCERPDSDIDAMVIVTPEYYAKKESVNETAECIFGYCDYEGGYFDVKYMTKEFIQIASERASEPTRNSFIGSQVLFSKDPEIENIVAKIPVFQESEMPEKQLSFYSALILNYEYFWKCCNLDGYMKLHTANEMIYCLYRLVLQENKVLFPCNRRLEEFVKKAPKKPEGFIEACEKFIATLETEWITKAIRLYQEWTSYDYPKEHTICQSRYGLDYEQWWIYPRPFINEW